MAKIFKDFTFCDKKLSDLSVKYMAVDFDGNNEIGLSLAKDFVTGDQNRYRIEPNYFYDTYSETLEFELDLVKDTCYYNNQSEMEITKSEIREITRWLTSAHFPEWIKFEYEENSTEDPDIEYYGVFSNIETFVAYGTVYGLKLTFKCTTPFGYTSEKFVSKTVTSNDTISITNDSDELFTPLLPRIEIYPHSNCDIAICNTSDCTLLDSGTLTKSDEENSYFESLYNKILEYAKLKGYTTKFVGKGAKNIIPLCNETAVQFRLVDKYSNETKCTAYYLDNGKKKTYYIVEGGFMYFQAYRDLNIYVDCQRLTIVDKIDRMFTYDKLNINDVDNMYWLKFLNGTNSLLLTGDADFVFKWRESRKVGE